MAKIQNFKDYKHISKIINLAALYHDIGKANLEFQNKLKIKTIENKRDLFRHELLSVLILNFIESELFNISSINNYKENFINYIKYIITEKQEFLNIDNPTELDAIKLLILTHHKIPTWPENGSSAYTDAFVIKKEFKDIEYFSQEKLYEIDKILTKDYLLISFNELNKIKSTLTTLKKEISSNNLIYIMFIGRFSLLSGDHYFSSQLPIEEITSSDILAKGLTEKIIGDEIFGDKIIVSQKLTTHLKGVSKYSNLFFKSFLNPDQKIFKEMSVETQKALKEKSNNSYFEWQDKNIDFVKKNHTSDFGFFVVSSSTGSGKTRFCSRLASEISSNNRFTTALGLRTLSLQTLDSYKEMIGINENDISLLIGQKEIEILNNETNEDLDEFIDDDKDYVAGINHRIENIENHMSLYFNKDNSANMLISPVLICTIDYLMKAITQSNSKFLNPYLRLKTSDLILDEVDNYDINDLMAIGKLLFLVGMFKRKIILSTATANKNLISYLYKMYSAGVNVVSNENIDFFWITDLKIENNFFKKHLKNEESFLTFNRI